MGEKVTIPEKPLAEMPMRSKLLGKAELPEAEAALLKRVVSLGFESERLKRQVAELSMQKKEICRIHGQLKPKLAAEFSLSKKILSQCTQILDAHVTRET